VRILRIERYESGRESTCRPRDFAPASTPESLSAVHSRGVFCACILLGGGGVFACQEKADGTGAEERAAKGRTTR